MNGPKQGTPPQEQSSPRLTEVGDFDRETEGYIVIAPLPEEAREEVNRLQAALAQHIPESALWLPQGDQLHLTFASVISTDTDYLQERADLFQQAAPQVDAIMPKIASGLQDEIVTFNEVRCFPAAIIVTGLDDGSIAQARNEFTENTNLPMGTRKPPDIIHATIARFRQPVDMDQLHSATASLRINFPFELDRLQLIHETKMYTQAHEVVKEYPILEAD
ncbi:MAG: hypothetical protein JWN01_677 [Patescibacteria group bacterium]|nr:hypothetical protein [Patescibacteria group bacterium]